MNELPDRLVTNDYEFEINSTLHFDFRERIVHKQPIAERGVDERWRRGQGRGGGRGWGRRADGAGSMARLLVVTLHKLVGEMDSQGQIGGQGA